MEFHSTVTLLNAEVTVLETDFDSPTQDARRQAVAGALALAPGLVRYAARYTHSIDDAEDAYQRAMEVALTRAPSVEPSRFVPWLYRVVRNEAIRLRDAGRREVAVGDERIGAELERESVNATRSDPDACAEWRERYRTVQDALGGLTETQRVCLILRTAGLASGEITELTGHTDRTVERAIVEGRARLRAFELRVASGQECERLASLIDTVIDGSAEAGDARRLERHVRHCRACRVALRDRREQARLMASLVPAVFLADDVTAGRPLDPTAALTWWERTTGGVTVRTGQLVQVWLDLPALMATKIGGGAVAAVVVGAVGTPIVVNAVQPRSLPAAHTAPAVATAAPAPTPVSTRTPPTRSSTTVRSRPVTAPRPATTTTPAKRTIWRARTAPRPRTAARTAPAVRQSAARPKVTRPANPASEFGP